METKLTFDEEIAVTSAIISRIRVYSDSIDSCRPLGLDTHVLRQMRQTLLSAYRKLTGVDFDSVHLD